MNWRGLLQGLDRSRDVKRPLYRAHRLWGLALFAGALFALDRLWFHYQPGMLSRIFAGWAEGEVAIVLGESVHLLLLGGNVMALGISLIVVFRPSLLKALERWADRSYGSRHSS